jgi:hypothetical protein
MSKNYKFNSKYFIADDSEEENIDVNWNVDSEEEKDNIDLDELDNIEDINDFEDLEEVNKKITNNPEINIEIVNNSGVKININLEIEKNKEKKCITIDFIINKETFLKIAKELKKK